MAPGIIPQWLKAFCLWTSLGLCLSNADRTLLHPVVEVGAFSKKTRVQVGDFFLEVSAMLRPGGVMHVVTLC